MDQITPLTANVTRAEADDSLATHWFGWFFFVSSLFWPRVCILTFWVFGQGWIGDAFAHRWAIPVAGFFLLPWTIMWYALMWGLSSDGVSGLEWVCVGVAFLIDVATWIEGRQLLRS
jgi:hypothetical protein